MVLGNIERLEIVIGRLDFRPLDHAEADGEENALELFVGLANQVPRANRALDAGQRKINLIARGGRLFPSSIFGSCERRKLPFDMSLQRVEALANGGLDLFGCGLQPVIADLGQDSRFPAEPLHARGFQIKRAYLMGNIAIECGAQVVE